MGRVDTGGSLAKGEQRNQLSIDNNNLLALKEVADVACLVNPLEQLSGPEPLRREPAFRIRPYRKADRSTICRLCCDSGYLGGPVDPLFQDRELFADLFTRPYLDYEPQWVFVAEANKKVIAYLLGSVRPNFDFFLMYSGFWTASKMLLRLASGRYSGHPRSRRFIRWLFTVGMSEQPNHPRHAAHLHVQVDRRYSALYPGRRLWEFYQEKLRENGVKQCYGVFYSYPGRHPEKGYSHYGFQVFDRRRTTLFEPEILDPVEVVCACKDL